MTEYFEFRFSFAFFVDLCVSRYQYDERLISEIIATRVRAVFFFFFQMIHVKSAINYAIKQIQLTRAKRACMLGIHEWLWFCFTLVENVSRVLLPEPIPGRRKAKPKQLPNKL